MTPTSDYGSRTCLECGISIAASKRGRAKRFCSPAHSQLFNNRAQSRGAHAYHLIRAIRRERDKAKQLGLWTELCRLELAWEDEDRAENRSAKSYKPPEMALADIAACERCIPSTNLYIREREPA